MPHGKFKERVLSLNLEVAKCPCGQTFVYKSCRDWNMKVRLHRKVCANPPEGSKHMTTPKKAMMLKEVHLHEAENMRRVHENH